ncbi:pentapeptide repeat-containing protein [Methanococcus aeolicus]|uniref:pentapeptide repeat-containing protein n=1 Tax=Methanococcus aeolicus TaxID=42879 RepID=UPI0021CA8226|nr:pentapeptide repeat-containing protein [Methanococcus aeolicus]UXM84205.1 pentapeptide repeat-containing protein [Methanococcus aeolicus]
MEKVKIIYNDKNKEKEDFYEVFINALKSEEKVFNLNDCVVDGSVSIVDIYDIIIKEEDDLKRKLINEKIRDKYIDIDIKLDIEIDFTNVEFKGHVDFYTGAYSKGTIPGGNYDGKLTFLKPFIFKNCKVSGDFKAMNCIFKNNANLSDSTFKGKVDFRNSEFNKYAQFNNTIFNEHVKKLDMKFGDLYNTNFSGVVFKDSCYFNGAEFYGKTEFSHGEKIKTKFLYITSFEKAKFFEGVEFNATFGIEKYWNNLAIKANFKNVEFYGDAFFNNSVFDIRTFFENCIFEKKAYFKSLFKNIVSFDKSIFNEHIRFECIFEILASFEETEFNHSVNFIYTKFNTNTEKIKSLLGGNCTDEELNNMAIMDFRETKFKNASFIGSEFNMRLEFFGAEFKNIDFYGVKFKSVSFEHCKCGGHFRFSNEHPNIKMDDMNTLFEGDLYINYCSFNGVVVFKEAEFKKNVEVVGCEFKKNVLFSETIFKGETNFEDTIFKKEVNFSSSTFNMAKFEKLTFESIAKFTDISFDLLSLRETIFKDIVLFKKKEENKNKGMAFFNLVNFKEPENTTIIDFPLSKTSFLLTDVKDTTIIAEAEKILSENILKNMSGDNTNDVHECPDDIKPYLRKETVLKEYRDIRMSFENNRTYAEASGLFIFEMNLIRKITTFDDSEYIEKQRSNINNIFLYSYIFSPIFMLFGLWDYIHYLKIGYHDYHLIALIILTVPFFILLIGLIIIYGTSSIKTINKCIMGITFYLYNIISNYGESITRPVFILIIMLLIIPCIITHSLNPFANWDLFIQNSRAFFQLGMDYSLINSTNTENPYLKTLYDWEWIIRLISLILLGNIFIAIKRRLERK